MQCGAVDECLNREGDANDPANCVEGGTFACGVDQSPSNPCSSFAENNSEGGVCVPIDGGLGFVIAGGLGMGVFGIRRRRELELEAV